MFLLGEIRLIMSITAATFVHSAVINGFFGHFLSYLGIFGHLWAFFVHHWAVLVVLCGQTLRVAHTFNPKNLDLSLRSESVSKSKEMFPPQLLGADWPNQTTCDPYIPSIQWEIEKYICWFLDDCPSQEVVDRWWSIIHTEINFSHNCLPQEVDDRW